MCSWLCYCIFLTLINTMCRDFVLVGILYFSGLWGREEVGILMIYCLILQLGLKSVKWVGQTVSQNSVLHLNKSFIIIFSTFLKSQNMTIFSSVTITTNYNK
ncbi:hypothetical protein RhiirA4_159842 [Rhizophagus irregularis]|uniref:Uncharacterized protein n=1 Tax=Rhizophagus irregularis TaxID=588596 RepID=A0A2I1HKY8_9GLOM|nr:hypothetical protein RhiirA4_159842 [Rhizophagus irregularis]